MSNGNAHTSMNILMLCISILRPCWQLCELSSVPIIGAVSFSPFVTCATVCLWLRSRYTVLMDYAFRSIDGATNMLIDAGLIGIRFFFKCDFSRWSPSLIEKRRKKGRLKGDVVSMVTTVDIIWNNG